MSECEHKNKMVVGEWYSYKIRMVLLVRECQDCGCIHLGNANDHYPSFDNQPHWGPPKETEKNTNLKT